MSKETRVFWVTMLSLALAALFVKVAFMALDEAVPRVAYPLAALLFTSAVGTPYVLIKRALAEGTWSVR